MSVKGATCKQTGDSNDGTLNDGDNNKDNKNKRLNIHGIDLDPHPSLDYELCDKYIPATAESPGFLRFKNMWLEEVPTIVINKTTRETYHPCEPYKNCKTGIVTVHNEFGNPMDYLRRPTNPVAPPKKKKVVKKQTRNPFKKFKRM